MALNEALLESRCDLAEHRRNIWHATCPDGVTPEDLMRPEYWSHIAHKLYPGDELLVFNDSFEWRLHYLVEDAWQTGARVALLSRHNIAGMVTPETDHDLRVMWRGPHSKWVVIRKDGAIIRSGLPSREVAQSHLVAMRDVKVA